MLTQESQLRPWPKASWQEIHVVILQIVKIALWVVASGHSLSLILSFKIPSLTYHDVSCLVKSNAWFDWCAVAGANLLVTMSLLVMLCLPQCREVPMQVQELASVYKAQLSKNLLTAGIFSFKSLYGWHKISVSRIWNWLEAEPLLHTSGSSFSDSEGKKVKKEEELSGSFVLFCFSVVSFFVLFCFWQKFPQTYHWTAKIYVIFQGLLSTGCSCGQHPVIGSQLLSRWRLASHWC